MCKLQFTVYVNYDKAFVTIRIYYGLFCVFPNDNNMGLRQSYTCLHHYLQMTSNSKLLEDYY